MIQMNMTTKKGAKITLINTFIRDIIWLYITYDSMKINTFHGSKAICHREIALLSWKLRLLWSKKGIFNTTSAIRKINSILKYWRRRSVYCPIYRRFIVVTLFTNCSRKTCMPPLVSSTSEVYSLSASIFHKIVYYREC